MKILITEEQYERLSGEMEEALGVPEGILDAGEEIYDLIVQELDDFNGDIEDLNKDGFEIDKEFTVGGHDFNTVKVKFDIEEHPAAKNTDMAGMSSENESELDDTLVLRSVRDPQLVIIGFKFYIAPGKGIEEITDYLKKYRKEDVPSLSHELKHAFRDVKQKGDKLSSRSSYMSNQFLRDSFGFIPEMRDFAFNSYFIHAVENVVRPTELASEMRMNNVSRKEFLKFFLNTEIVKRLKDIQNFSYDRLKEQLLSEENIDSIKKLFDAIDDDYEGKTDEQIVARFLRLYLVNATNKKNELVNQFLTSSFAEMMLGLQGDKDKFFRKYVAQTTKFGNDYDAYFRNEEEYFHRVSTMMIKKLAKLYAMAKNNPPE
jgi:hypothetical protein